MCLEIHADEIRKTQEEWNRAGTFGSVVTLKKHQRCERRRRRAARLNWHTDYDWRRSVDAGIPRLAIFFKDTVDINVMKVLTS